MKKIMTSVATFVACTLLLTSCSTVSSPVLGVLYTSAKGPGAVTSNTLGQKVGTSEATSILGLIGTGDASVEAAAKAAGIKKISHVDYEASNILGIYAKHTTIVYGE